MSEEAAKIYLGAIQASLNSPNMVLDLRIPQNQRYQQIVLDTAVAALPGRRDRHRATMKRSSTAGTRSPRSSARTTSWPPTRRTHRRQVTPVRSQAVAPDLAGRRRSRRASGCRTRHDLVASSSKRSDRLAPGRGVHRCRAVLRDAGRSGRSLLDLSADRLGLSVAVALQARYGRLHARLHRLAQLPEAAVRLAAVPSPRHVRRLRRRSAGWPWRSSRARSSCLLGRR